MSVFAEEWKGFHTGKWCDNVNVRDFIQCNYSLYEGDESFLTGFATGMPQSYRRGDRISEGKGTSGHHAVLF